MSPPFRLVAPSRLHRLADEVFLAAIRENGLPGTDEDTLALAKDAYRAAEILMGVGLRREGAMLGAQVGRKK